MPKLSQSGIALVHSNLRTVSLLREQVCPLSFRTVIGLQRFQTLQSLTTIFVAQNVCAGIAIETAHRQNLHELILGVQGVALNTVLQGYVDSIEKHIRELRTIGDAIPAAVRGSLSVDAFCDLPAHADIDGAIRHAEREVAAAQSSDAVRNTAAFGTLILPWFDRVAIEALLVRTLPDLEVAAAQNVQVHLAKLGKGGAAWVGEGIQRIDDASTGHDKDICPFCAQDLGNSSILRHYQAYFSKAYNDLKRDIGQYIQVLNIAHGDAATLTFERSVIEAERSRAFWSAFLEAPEIEIDTSALTLAWNQTRDAVAHLLAAKQGSPLERARMTKGALAAIEAYEAAKAAVVVCTDRLQACNAQIALVKECSAGANAAELIRGLTNL